MSKITRVKLENLTAFGLLDLTFSPGVNILIGANGTGKTHLLKVLYAACAITVGEDAEKGFGLKLRNVFNPYEGRIGRISRRQSTSVKTKIAITRQGGSRLSAEFSNHTNKVDDIRVIGESGWQKEVLESAYIPVKEMLAHAPGFLATAAKREIAFEEVYVDIIKRAFLPKLMGPTDKDRARLLNALQRALEGKVIAKGEYFFLKNKQGDLEFTLLAEGMRKLALIWLLIQNGTLLSGSVLFWDEPEANLNPSLMGDVVEVILELQRLGVQVYLSTHNYVLLKEFDLRRKKGDAIRYISLYRDEAEAVVGHVSDTFRGVDPNTIADTFTDLYQRDIFRALKGGAE
ncbi:MAG: AAA family ATPase [Desulfuromonadales bacterium GWD2_61_12]|nr:MAG: AAA family ATPase [Desulfuromonadales bacterium GWC2_61_20]OGR32531.1 MAG: AAA family ATPase [Desulfuromonadales bacterium GWD2_61_12]HAD04160.1 AAA family ATPase [Desulfuromonas sp.]